MSDGPTSRRRTVLATCAAGMAALAGCGNPLSDSGGDGDTPTEDGSGTSSGGGDGTANGTSGSAGQPVDGSTVRFGGVTEGWTGQEPDSIVGETNPPLELQAGTTYEVVWENLDGEEHELIVVDENDEEVAASDSSEQQGETVTMELDPEEGLAAYYCEYHPEAMRGEIEVVAGE